MALAERLRRRGGTTPSPNAMTLAQHLAELRRRLFISTIVFLLAATIAFLGYNHILEWLREPYCRANHNDCTLYVTGPLDGLALRIKVAAFGGLVLASPVLLFELWRFITPGLKRNEKRYAVPFVAASIVLFLTGGALGYFSFEHALVFLAEIGGPSLHQIYNPNQYLSLIMWMMIIFGLTFEFPVILVALEMAHVVTPAQLLHAWRWAIIGITLAAAIFTPSGDPFSMLVLAVPLVAFYFLSIGIGKLAGR
jgi:sec-independent protein translocase protein TatC